MSPSTLPSWQSRGLRRLIRSFAHSAAGFVHGLRRDAAIRQVLAGLVIMLPIALWLPLRPLEHLVLVLSMMLVVFAEFINSAIEATVDRVSLEPHPLAKQAKDLASAAVGIAVLMSGLSWLVLAGPLLVAWLAS